VCTFDISSRWPCYFRFRGLGCRIQVLGFWFYGWRDLGFESRFENGFSRSQAVGCAISLYTFL